MKVATELLQDRLHGIFCKPPYESGYGTVARQDYTAFSVNLLMKVATELLQDRLGNEWNCCKTD